MRLWRRVTVSLEHHRPESAMDEVMRTFSERGDLAHLALFLWASGASGALLFTLRELAAASRRFDDFIRELSRFNRRAGQHDERG
jgi:hypothetical protein